MLFKYILIFHIVGSLIADEDLHRNFTNGINRSPFPWPCYQATCNCIYPKCANSGYPILGGLDIIQYFTTFKFQNGSWNEAEIGKFADGLYSSQYGGFLFYFLSVRNKLIFDTNPLRYVPQFGGYCSWGIATEFCSSRDPFPWSNTCLGPKIFVGAWTILDDKLYFFLGNKLKDMFKRDAKRSIRAGNERWNSWFGTSGIHLNTHCYSFSRDRLHSCTNKSLTTHTLIL